MTDVRRFPAEAGGRAVTAEAAVGSKIEDRRNTTGDDAAVPVFAGDRMDPRRGGDAPPVPGPFITERRRPLDTPAVASGVDPSASTTRGGGKRELLRGATIFAMLTEPRRAG